MPTFIYFFLFNILSTLYLEKLKNNLLNLGVHDMVSYTHKCFKIWHCAAQLSAEAAP